MKAFGGLKEVLQLMSNHGSMEQPEPTPMPNGYGTVRFPHRRGHPGFVVTAALVMVELAVVAVVVVLVSDAASDVNAEANQPAQTKATRKCMFFGWDEWMDVRICV